MKKTLLAILLASSAISAHAEFTRSQTGTLSSPNLLERFDIDLQSADVVTFTSLGYAGGVNLGGTTVQRGGFDTVFSLFDSTGNLITDNDDGRGVIDPDSGHAYDSYISASLQAGRYTLLLGVYPNFPTGNIHDVFRGGISFGGRSSAWALDIESNSLFTTKFSEFIPPIAPPVAAVPEPETYALMVAGLGLLGFASRRRQTNMNA